MGRFASAVALFCVLASTGCRSVSDPIVCTLIAVSSLNVTVRDAATGQRICDATVIAIQGGVTYELRRSGDAASCGYAGPEERPGVFEIRASKAGYRPATLGDVRVNADECHVIPAVVTMDLSRTP